MPPHPRFLLVNGAGYGQLRQFFIHHARYLVEDDGLVHNKHLVENRGLVSATYVSGIHYAREAERSPCDGDWLAAHHVVDDLVATQERGRIGLVLAVDGQSDYKLRAWHLDN